VVECNNPAFEGNNTVNDTIMGITEASKLCNTCGQSYEICPGHLGRIHLAKPFINPLAILQTIYILKSICNTCGMMLISPQVFKTLYKKEISGYRDINLLKKVSEITTASNKTQCTSAKNGHPHICTPNPSYDNKQSKDTYKIMMYSKTKKSKKNDDRLNETEKDIEQIITLFQTVIREEMDFLGFHYPSSPLNFVMEYFPVIPECNRPSKIRDGNIDHDQLTCLYSSIINLNNKLKSLYILQNTNKEKNISNSETLKSIEETERCLYVYTIRQFMDNANNKYKISGSNEPVQGIAQRLVKNGKESYMRKNGMGKRVNYGARTVLGPGCLPFGYIEYPEETKILTVPEIVTSRNIERIVEQYKNGLIPTIINYKTNIRISTIAETKAGRSRVIKIGDKVFINSHEGVETLFNRQPTLHKYSIMAYTKKISSDKNIKLHSSYTSPHNADFDGDEGNEHVPQTNEAIAECRYIASVKNCIIGNQFSRPIMGIVFHGILSAYSLTKNKIFFEQKNWDEAINITTRDTDKSRINDNFEERLKKNGVEPLSNQALMSILFPSDFFYENKGVSIRDGILKKGTINSSHIGPANYSIIHILYKFYNQDTVVRFFTEAQYLLDWFLEFKGFSIGLKDCFPLNKESMEKSINDEITKVKILIDKTYKENMSQFDKKIQEENIEGYLSNIMASLSQVIPKNLKPDNPLVEMIDSGAKGNKGNIIQIVGCLGEQFIKGKLPELDITQNSRCLPYFEENSRDIEARGFVRSNFGNGLEPDELIFHLAAARIGIINTSISTSDTGHIHHRITKVLEDIKINYHGAVVNSNDVIFQYTAGFNSTNIMKINTKNTGDVLSPVDFKTIIGKINHDSGYEDEW